MSYIIQLDQFEGPFDLLLFFIKRDELDIHDIPISKITADFLAYIRELEEMNMNVAGEFILVAATLMRIKSKMLLPRKELDEDGLEIDPRADLISKLIEYKRFKSVLSDFEHLESLRQKKEGRGNFEAELKTLTQKSLIDSELEALSLFKIMQAFRSVMEKMEDRERQATHEVALQQFHVEEERAAIRRIITASGRSSFQEVFATCENKKQAIVRFLALLEQLSQRLIKITLGEGINNFWLMPTSDEEE